jgi:hypothetical protein
MVNESRDPASDTWEIRMKPKIPPAGSGFRTTTNGRARLPYVLIGSFSCAVTLSAQVEYHRVNDPRPVSQAIELLERECSCVITYEDPRYGSRDVDDVTTQVRRDKRSEPRVFVPRIRFFEFSHEPPRVIGNARDIEPSLTAMLAAFHDSGATERFRMVRDGAVEHVVPVQGSVLDTRLSPGDMNATAAMVIKTVLERVGARTGVKIRYGVVPSNIIEFKTVRVAAAEESAQQILTRSLAATGVSLSWRLNFDYATGDYVLNIHVVPGKEPTKP